jgi:porphobilinogen synthase
MSVMTGKFPEYRPRRLRGSAALRNLVRETELSARQLILPMFARGGAKVRQAIGSMPGCAQVSVDELVRDCEAAIKDGVGAVLLFGIPEAKDDRASGAYDEDGIVQRAVRAVKKEFPDFLVVTDVCLCEYMSHGHCGLAHDEGRGVVVRNDASLELLAKAAVSHAAAGADIVAPSDMMDGRVGAIRTGLDKAGFDGVPIMSYAVKFASSFYGPFREAAESAPQFGDRRSYQMEAGNSGEAMREAAMDVAEGADILMVKPALSYLDILYRVKNEFGYPTAAYAVSAEYSMIKAAAEKGWIDERGIVLESHLAMRRAGADIIITYWAREIARWLKGA